MVDFPTLTTKMDRAKYSESVKDPALRAETEGGYVITRPRTTRAPGKTFTIGYSNISAADKATLDAFYRTVRGGSDSFNWTNDADGDTYIVRFSGKFTAKPTANDDNGKMRWDVDGIALEQV